MVPYYSILLSFKRIGPLENTAGDKKKADKRDILNKRLDRKNPYMVKNGERWGFYRKDTILIYQTKTIFRLQRIASYTPSWDGGTRLSTVTSEEAIHVFQRKTSGRRDALCDQIYVQDKQQ